MEDTGQDPRPPEVAFGPKPHQVVSVEVAAMILTDWREASPAQLGKYLARAMTGVDPAGSRGK
jgi:hypothetical protein